jgi:Predicted transcriptional regulators
MPTIKEAVAVSFKSCRKNAGYTQQEIADAMRTHRVTISRWENGVYEPDCKALRRMSALYGCSLDALLAEEGSGCGFGCTNT